jgi:ABC-type multidrug transport system ATPase subunit
VLLSSHLMGETEMIADRVVLMDKSRVIGTGEVANLAAEHGSLEQAFFARLNTSRNGTAGSGAADNGAAGTAGTEGAKP